MDQQLIDWAEQSLKNMKYGEVKIIFHVREGKIAWIEKVKIENTKEG